MELWIVKLLDFETARMTSKPYTSEAEAKEGLLALVQPLLDDGFESVLENNDTSVELTKGAKRYEASICHTDQFEMAPEIVVNDYTYSDRYILEVMHDFTANTAALYVYDREYPETKIAIANYDLTSSPISDSEIIAIAAPDLDETLESLDLLNKV